MYNGALCELFSNTLAARQTVAEEQVKEPRQERKLRWKVNSFCSEVDNGAHSESDQTIEELCSETITD